MNPLGDFFVEFTTKGLAELKEGLKDVNKSLDGLAGDFATNTKNSEGFFGKFKGWATSIGLVTAAIWAMHKALKETFQVSKEIRGLYKSADMLGVDPATLERWTLVARLHDGSQGDVTSFFAGLNDMSRNLKEGKYSNELLERMARYGFSEQYLYGASLPENRDKLIGDLNRLLNRKDLNAADIQALQSVFTGLNDTMVSILKSRPQDLQNQLAWGENQRVLTKDDKYLKDAAELNKTLIEVQQTFKQIWLEFQAPLRDLLEALKPLAQPLGELAESVAALVEALAPIIAWCLKQLSGGLSFWADVLKATQGKISWGDLDNKYRNEELTPGWAGQLYRWFGDQEDPIAAAQRDNQNALIEIDALPGSPLANNVSNRPVVNNKVSGYLEMNINGQKVVQSPEGNLFDAKTGESLGRAAWASSVQGG